MYRLILDSSTKLLIIGLLEDNNLIATKMRIAKKDHAYYISNYLDTLLKENNVKPKDIKEVIIGKGPGSYTGVRVSGTFAKVFSYALKISLKSISSLFLLTSGYKEKHIALYNAKNGRYYLGGYSCDDVFLQERVYLDEEIKKDSLLDNVLVIDLTDDETLKNNVKIDYKKVIESSVEENYFLYEPNYSYTNIENDKKN